MPPSTPFVDRESGELDTTQIVAEAIPLAKLVGLFVAVALVPLVLMFLTGPSGIGVIFTLMAQLIFAIGSGIVLMYVVARGIQLADDEADRRSGGG